MPHPNDGEADAHGPAAAGRPRWVKIAVVVAIVVALLLGTVMLLSGGTHGPGRHMSQGPDVGSVAHERVAGV